VSSNRWRSEAKTDSTTDRRWSVASVRHTGKSTNGWKALEFLRDRGEPVDRVVVFTVASYGDLVTPEGDENVYNVSGWSEDVLSSIAHAENSKQAIDEIDAFEPA
jgi:hypothetical protein